MGRHSATDDDDDEPTSAAPAVATAPKPGRHARPAEGDDAVEPPAPAPPLVPAVRPKPRPGKGNQSTAADLALLREHSDVRSRCIAAVVVPFVLYTATLYLIGDVRLYLIWVWIPLVTAGVLAGSILDAEHRRRQEDSPDA